MTPNELPAEWREWYEERAAIREYDGEQTRDAAEAEAMRELLEFLSGRSGSCSRSV